MNIAQITPGAGGMYCGGCFRDNALVSALRKLGHNVALVPLYLPMKLDEDEEGGSTPIFFGGINVYLEQKFPTASKIPKWLHRLLDSPALLGWAARSAAKTRPEELGELTLSMLRGEEGRQARELDELADWLKSHFRPDIICLSNALLVGLVRRLKRELNVPIICLLAGEDTFLDGLPESHRQASWQTLAARAREVDCFAAASEYYGARMQERLRLAPDRVKVVYNGINLDGYHPASAQHNPPVLGYFARMCKEKGLHTLVEAFIQLKRRDRVKGLKLRVGGGLSPVDERSFVRGLQKDLRTEGLLDEVEFCPNLTRAQKLEFYRSLSVLSVPALYGEAFGLYVIEAWASGVPVVQPRHAAFPELIHATEAGVLCEPNDVPALVHAIEELLLEPNRLHALGQAGRAAALARFNIEVMAENMSKLFQQLILAPPMSEAGSSPPGGLQPAPSPSSASEAESR